MSDKKEFFDVTQAYSMSNETGDYTMSDQTLTLSAPDGQGFKDVTQGFVFVIC